LSAAPAPPKRYVVCFAGMSLGRDNTGKLSDIVPDKLGADYDLKVPLAPLADVKREVTVVSGLDIPTSGPGGRIPEFHKSSLSPLLSGVHPTSPSPNCLGPTSDQVVAAAPGFAGQTAFPSLCYRVQAQPYRGGGNVGVISWRRAGQKNDPIVSPRVAFETLFPHASTPERREEASVLDVVGVRARRLRARLGSADQQRLDRHFDEIRALEQRLHAIADSDPRGETCAPPRRPGSDPAVEKVLYGNVEIGYSQEEERAQVLTALTAKAFRCDLARVAALQMTCAQCFMNVESLVGVKIDLHELAHLSHVQGGKDVAQQKVMEMYGWHMKHFASLIRALRDDIGSDGRPVLDHTVLVFVNEGGLGPAEGKNPASHSTENMMVLVAGGRACGLKPGRHVASVGEHPARVLATAMHAAGAGNDGLGEVKGRVDWL
jgi:hypothetical protein